MELYSYHVFLFPFQWQFAGIEMQNKTLEDRTCLKELVTLFDKSNWKRRDYKVDTILNYNEYNYFYGMVREVLFDEGVNLGKTIIANLTYDIEPDIYRFCFKVYDSIKRDYKTYSLHIDSIILHLYSTGVGVLSFHLNNRLKDQSDKEDILKINQSGRRLYPPFFGMDVSKVGSQEQFNYKDFSKGLDVVKTSELAKDFSLISDTIFEDFNIYRNADNFSKNPFQVPNHISFLFQGIPITVNREDFNSNTRRVYINPLIDDRMFVVCWYGNDEIIEDLKADDINHCKDIDGNIIYHKSDWWYKFIFIDQNLKTCQNSELMKKLISKHTYTRWSDYGTLYGVNRYSFVCLTSSLDTLKKNNSSFLVNHVQTMYYKICELCLVQRACILRFSDEVTRISAMNEKKKISLIERVGNLYKQYMRFVNKVYFREITAQEQGVELYNMLQRNMNIEHNVKDLDKEIKELLSYISLIQSHKQSRNIELLTIIGALFVMPTFIMNFIGVIILPRLKDSPPDLLESILILSPLLLSPIIYYLIDKERAKKYMIWLITFVLGVILLSSIFMNWVIN